MDITQEQLEAAGYDVPAAPEDAWRSYDERNPVPRYFDFDWLSSRHPDLYHTFALSSEGLVDRLNARFDLSGLDVLDIGAGTGRITHGAARTARSVTAVDPFGSVLAYNKRLAAQTGLNNITHVRADSRHLPFADNSFNAATCAWAIASYPEAGRVLKPGGWLIDLLPFPGALGGELTPLLAQVYPHIITEVAPADQLDRACPEADSTLQQDSWNGVPVTPPIRLHDFTYLADYHSPAEAAAIIGRLFGPKARQYMEEGGRSSLAWRLRIVLCRVRK